MPSPHYMYWLFQIFPSKLLKPMLSNSMIIIVLEGQREIVTPLVRIVSIHKTIYNLVHALKIIRTMMKTQ